MDVRLPRYAESYDGYILMKFTSKVQYQQDFLDGRLYFNELDWFAKCENRGQGDRNEGASLVENYSNTDYQSLNIEVIDGEVLLVQRDYSKAPEAYKPSTVHFFSSAENRKVKIICLYTSFLDVKNATVQDFPPNMKDEFGNYGILILNRFELFNRLAKAIAEKADCSSGLMGFVNYVELEPGINEWHPFKKEKMRFGYQNEFRVAFKSDRQGAVILDIGSVRDIAVPVLAEDVDKICIKDGKLKYPLYCSGYKRL
mgnify:CR=1 FL=1